MIPELRALMRAVIADHPHTDISKLARLTREATPHESVMSFYEAALTIAIQQLIGADRRQAFQGPDRAQRKLAYRSPNVEERRSWWASLLRQRVVVGGNVLLLGDCGKTELISCIEERRRQVAGFEKQITHFEHLLDLLAKHKKPKVKDLPPQTNWPS